MIYMDTHSVNLSKDVEEVLALIQVQLIPISAGTPQELAFAETPHVNGHVAWCSASR